MPCCLLRACVCTLHTPSGSRWVGFFSAPTARNHGPSFMAYDNTNSGILTRNDKQGNENRPDYRGSINVDGVDYWLSAWIKEGRDGTKLAGQKYMSLSLQPKEARQDYAAPVPASSPAPAPRRMTQAEQDARYAAERRQQERAPRAATGTGFDSMDDDIPF